MIEIKNITKNFGDLVAVNNVSLKINNNETFALLGLNGAGKTTLINCLCSLLKPTSGTATFDNFDLLKETQKVKEMVNISPQETAIAKNLTVKENLELIACLYGIKDKNLVTDMLVEFDLTAKANKLAKTLSGGQQRRLSIALAMISNPKFLFLDEPTLGLDVKARNSLWKIIESIKAKTTIILTTHYLEEVEKLADRIGIMQKGELKVVGTLTEIKQKTKTNSLEEAFLKFTGEEDE